MYSLPRQNPFDISQRIGEVARQNRARIAIVQGEENWSYGDLADRVADLVEGIRALGVHVLASLVPKSLDAYAILLACLEARVTYVPVPSDSPPAKFEQVARIVRPDIVLHGEGASQEIMRAFNGLPNLLTVDQLVNGEGKSVQKPGREISEIAYIVTTSGSTGRPKMVGIDRESLSWFIQRAVQAIGADGNDTWSQQTSLGFDLSFFDILGCFYVGGVLSVPGSRLDVALPARWIRRDGITMWQSVPSIVRSMIASGEFTSANVASLERMSFCGESLSMAVCRQVWEVADVRIYNSYGPTETTVFCFAGWVSPSWPGGFAPVGHIFDGQEFRLENREMILSGAGVKRGYLFQDGDTGGFRLRGNELEFWTGDTFDLVGEELVFAGRLDRQVKVNGVRVELAEVEHWIAECGYPASCVVLIDGVLRCVVQAASGFDAAALQRRLGSYMVAAVIPRSFRLVRELPLNVNGKVDRLLVSELLRRNDT
jgi:non-ribosomal peptide synthetase component F